MTGLLPTPRRIARANGCLRIEGAVSIVAHGIHATPARDWLAACVEHDHAVATSPDPAPTAIHLGLLDDLLAAGLAHPDWRHSEAFATQPGRLEGYVLTVSPQAAVVAALDPRGLQCGAATLLQCLERHGEAVVARACRIDDWPDFRFRVGADWLLNAEVNRWGYERGDGREALVARLKRKLDLAARHKINAVWFDGFGWSTTRIPDYVGFVREVGDYARDRHIRLAFCGYGGGYGFAYQTHQLYAAPYHGQAFENRTSYPDGEVYDCVGHPNYPTSWRYGTCLSNQALAELKVAELVKFVRECRPGMLYIHDIDTGELDRAQAGWRRRCPRCRERWPDDEMVSEHGGAAAQATWLRHLVTAIDAVVTDDGRYAAARDCELVFVGPVYTGCHDTDPAWAASCDYLAMVSRLVGPFPNVQFGIREQLVSDRPKGTRVSMLRAALDAAGQGHGVFVVAFAGGDTFYNDQLVSPAPTLHGYYRGADTVYTKSMGAVAEPAQLVCAEFAWHADAAGAFPIAATRHEAMAVLRDCTHGVATGTGIFGTHGLLRRACDRLYGERAGEPLAQLFSLGAGDGVSPLATGWGMASKEVARLVEGNAETPGDAASHWQQRATVTAAALAHLAAALAEPLPDAHVREDVAWLRTCLEVGSRLCRALSACWRWKAQPDAPTHAEAVAAVNNLAAFLDAHVPTQTTDPIGGDIAVWRAIASQLWSMISA